MVVPNIGDIKYFPSEKIKNSQKIFDKNKFFLLPIITYLCGMFEMLIPIYDVKLLVSIGQSDKEFLSSLKKTKFKCGKQCLIPDAEAYFIPFEAGNILIRCKHKLKKAAHIGILSHEVLHATIYILHRAGFRLTKHSEEAFTYLQEYIITQILKQNKWK